MADLIFIARAYLNINEPSNHHPPITKSQRNEQVQQEPERWCEWVRVRAFVRVKEGERGEWAGAVG